MSIYCYYSERCDDRIYFSKATSTYEEALGYRLPSEPDLVFLVLQYREIVEAAHPLHRNYDNNNVYYSVLFFESSRAKARPLQRVRLFANGLMFLERLSNGIRCDDIL